MYSGDIKLDSNGNSVIANGDFVLTEDNASFINTMLKTFPGTWDLYPYLGIGLEQFIGQKNDEEARGKIKYEIETKLKLYGLPSKVVVLPVDETTIACQIESYAETGVTVLRLSFNFTGGATEVISAEKKEYTKIVHASANKYLSRR